MNSSSAVERSKRLRIAAPAVSVPGTPDCPIVRVSGYEARPPDAGQHQYARVPLYPGESLLNDLTEFAGFLRRGVQGLSGCGVY
jgi:hypothetical protein